MFLLLCLALSVAAHRCPNVVVTCPPLVAQQVTCGDCNCCGDGQSSTAYADLSALHSTTLHCHNFALTVLAEDHARSPADQGGPLRGSRALAIVHWAMFEGYLAIKGGYQSALDSPLSVPAGASSEAAVVQAMHDTLSALYPAQQAAIDAELARALAELADSISSSAITGGRAVGLAAASAVLANRLLDGSERPEVSFDTYIAENPHNGEPGWWTMDPISRINVALGYHWNDVRPFVMTSASQFRSIPPPALTSNEYMMAFDEVKAMGGDKVNTIAVRSGDDEFAGVYWGYDGAPHLGVPPRGFNQIITQIAVDRQLAPSALLRLLALVNIAMADAGIAAWDTKYHYKVWRPVAAIRGRHSDGTHVNDGNPSTTEDVTWTPLGAPASNSLGRSNFTPPFPAYPSGHSTFGAAALRVAERVFGSDDIPFTFFSDEFNGVTFDNQGRVRPRQARSFMRLSQAAEENGQSRMYLGIHWNFDKTAGLVQGHAVGDWVVGKMFAAA